MLGHCSTGPEWTPVQARTREGDRVKWSSAPKHTRLCCWAALLSGAAGPAPASSWLAHICSLTCKEDERPTWQEQPTGGHAGRYGEQQTQALLLPGPQCRRPARRPLETLRCPVAGHCPLHVAL